MNQAGVVVVGAGAAGTAAAGTLHHAGYPGPITVVRGEPGLPYNRTAVNKALLQGTLTVDALALPEATLPGIEWTTADRAVGVDTEARTVTLAGGRTMPYQSLVIATGASPRSFPGDAHPRTHKRILTLRTAGDTERLRALLSHLAGASRDRPPRVTILGTGLIGSETAGVLSAAGVKIDLVGLTATPMVEQVGRTVGEWLSRRHQEHVRTHFERTVTAVDAGGADEIVATLTGGEEISSDVLLVCIGVTPCTGWLAGTGLESSRGIAVDERLRARGVSGVYAAGDLANITDDHGNGHRTEHWTSALAQGQHAARTLLHDAGVIDSDPGDYTHLPSYSTRIYGTGIVVNGNPGGFTDETVIAGDPGQGRFTVALTDAENALVGVVGVGGARLANALKDAVQRKAPLPSALAAATS